MEKPSMTYPEELKRNALNLVLTSDKIATAGARALGIDPELLNRWRWEASREGNGSKAFIGPGLAPDEEMATFIREFENLRETNEILKKPVAIFSMVGGQK